MKSALRPLDLVALDDIAIDIFARAGRAGTRRVIARTEIDCATGKVLAIKLTPSRRSR